MPIAQKQQKPIILDNFDSQIDTYLATLQKKTSSDSNIKDALVSIFGLIKDHYSDISEQKMNQVYKTIGTSIVGNTTLSKDTRQESFNVLFQIFKKNSYEFVDMGSDTHALVNVLFNIAGNKSEDLVMRQNAYTTLEDMIMSGLIAGSQIYTDIFNFGENMAKNADSLPIAQYSLQVIGLLFDKPSFGPFMDQTNYEQAIELAASMYDSNPTQDGLYDLYASLLQSIVLASNGYPTAPIEISNQYLKRALNLGYDLATKTPLPESQIDTLGYFAANLIDYQKQNIWADDIRLALSIEEILQGVTGYPNNILGQIGRIMVSGVGSGKIDCQTPCISSEINKMFDWFSNSSTKTDKNAAIYFIKRTVFADLSSDTSHYSDIMQRTDQFVAEMADNDPNKPLVGELICLICFKATDYLKMSKYSQMLMLDSATAEGILANSPQWTDDFIAIPNTDRIFDLGAAYPGVPIVKNLFENYNITGFSYYPMEILKKQNDRMDQLTGKQPWLISVTKHNWNGAAFCSYLKPEYADMFDIYIIEPGDNDNTIALAEKTASRLGIMPNDISESGPKFEWFGLSGHGSPSGVQQIILPSGGKEDPITNAIKKAMITSQTVEMSDEEWKNYNENRLKNLFAAPSKKSTGDKILGNDLFVGTDDGPMLRSLSRFFTSDPSKRVGYLDACSTSGDNGGEKNIAETISENMKMKIYGAQVPSGGGRLELSNASGKYQLVGLDATWPYTVYDYANTANFDTKNVSVTPSFNGYLCAFTAQNSDKTEGYDIQRSSDGKAFDNIANLKATNPGGMENFTYTDDNVPQPNVYYRFKQRNVRAIDDKGSKYYSFAYSAVVDNHGGSTMVGDNAVRPNTLDASSIYPNPVSQTATLRLSLLPGETASVHIYNSLGVQVSEFKGISENDFRFDLDKSLAVDGYSVLIDYESANGSHHYRTSRFIKSE